MLKIPLPLFFFKGIFFFTANISPFFSPLTDECVCIIIGTMISTQRVCGDEGFYT